MQRAAAALFALAIVTPACQDDAKQREAAEKLATEKAELECEQRFAMTSCSTSEFSDEENCVSTLTDDHKAENEKFFDSGATYHEDCAASGLKTWPFTRRCQEVCAVFTGDIAEGERCNPDEAELCQQGLVCDEGHCTDPINLIANANEPCAGGQNRKCAEGLACTAEGTCVTAPAVGSPCLPTGGGPSICDLNHYCDDNGLCQNKRALGQSCTRAEMCETFNCDVGQCAVASQEPPICWGEGTLYACISE